MKARTIVVTLVMCLVGLTFAFAADNAWMGTWKLNEAKSKLPSAARNSTVVYAAAGDQVKITIDGVDAKGAPVHNDWTGKFDGKEYPVAGDATSDSRSYRKVDDHTLHFTAKKSGKVTLEGNINLSADGKTRTVEANGTDPDGKKIHVVAVYDKQ